MKAKEVKVIKPEPYYNITFGCSNRAFYDVINEVSSIWDNSGIEDDFSNGYYTIKSDYEGDPEKMIIYNEREITPFLKNVVEFYGGNFEDVKDMDIVLSIF